MQKIDILNIAISQNGTISYIHPVLLSNNKNLILVDAGYPGQLEDIAKEIAKNGRNIQELTHIIVTHHDYDHIGSLAAIKKAYPHITIISSLEEAPYISGQRKSLRLVQAERIYGTIPEKDKPGAQMFQDFLASIEPIPVDNSVIPETILSNLNFIKILSTPGHMPGHISLYIEESKTMITGDALVIENERLAIANPQYTLDIELAKSSIKKIATYDIETIICYHGGMLKNNCQQALAELISYL